MNNQEKYKGFSSVAEGNLVEASDMDKINGFMQKISHYLENLRANRQEKWKSLAQGNTEDAQADVIALRLDEQYKEISKKIEETRAQAAALVKKTKEKEEKQRQTKNTKVSVANKAREGGR